ncbi:MAG: hypothetical protein KDI50_10555, partial [Candidatus Competibacteraceae bacterium]|nr:hypothetical protein [Candidatus Competibacteraceae bacterium]
MNKTRLSLALHQIFNPQGHQFATGVIIEGDPPRRLIPPLNAWVTLTALKPPPRRGRKQNLARKAAVGLAHAWHCDRLNLSKSAADRALASHFGYSDERAARRARIDGEKVLQSGYFYFSLI